MICGDCDILNSIEFVDEHLESCEAVTLSRYEWLCIRKELIEENDYGEILEKVL